MEVKQTRKAVGQSTFVGLAMRRPISVCVLVFSLVLASFMGTIMAIGVAVANAILLITFAEQSRKDSNSALYGAISGAESRLRPILMTSGAMLVGMLPMASGLGDGGEQTALLQVYPLIQTIWRVSYIHPFMNEVETLEKM